MRRCALTLLLLALSAAGQTPAAGKLLVASPKVTNAQFRHTVILVIDYGAKGAAGLVLNRTTSKPLAELFPAVASAHARTDTAYWGGPVAAAQVFCLVAINGSLREARQVLPGVYFSNNQNLMDLALNARQTGTSFRVYLGFAGWSPEQIRREMAAGDWRVQPATAAEIFDPAPGTLWERLTATGKAMNAKVRNGSAVQGHSQSHQ